MYHQIATAGDVVRAALRTRFDRAVRAQVGSWVAAEIGPWGGRLRTAGRSRLAAEVQALNASDPWIQVYRVEGRVVVALPKPATLSASLSPADAAAVDKRGQLYGRFLASAAAPGPVHVAINLSDVPYEPGDTPVFSFQKDAGSRAILLPDIDLLNDKYVRPSWLSRDATPFRRKANSAIFVGSTTGGLIDADTVRTLALPRLRAAAAFRGHPRIHFLLPGVVQCVDAGVAAAVRRAVGAHAPVSWHDQFRHRFILSMDGNGATCSRVVVALKSNSALVKYESARQLYYFHGLRAGTHYVAVHGDAEVDPILSDADAHPARYERIARAGSRFYRSYLTQPMVRYYMTRLLAAYAAAQGA